MVLLAPDDYCGRVRRLAAATTPEQGPPRSLLRTGVNAFKVLEDSLPNLPGASASAAHH
jgi:hypothetical protein